MTDGGKRRELTCTRPVNSTTKVDVNSISVETVGGINRAYLKLEKQICGGREENDMTAYANQNISVKKHQMSLLRTKIS